MVLSRPGSIWPVDSSTERSIELFVDIFSDEKDIFVTLRKMLYYGKDMTFSRFYIKIYLLPEFIKFVRVWMQYRLYIYIISDVILAENP